MNITSNFFEIVLSKNQVVVPYLNFENKQQLDELRKNNPQSIFMPFKDKLFFWGDNSISREMTQEINKEGNLFSNILANSWLKLFNPTTYIKIRKKLHVYEITFFNKDTSNGKYQGLRLYKTFHLHFTPFYINSNIVKTGFTVSASVSEKIFWTVQDFQQAGIQYDDLLHDEKTGEVFINTKSKYRLAHHFNYASKLKNQLDVENAIQHEFREINDFVETYFKQNINKLNLPDSLQIYAINKTSFRLGNQQSDFKSKLLSKPQRYFYNGKYRNFQANSSIRETIENNRPFAFDEFENRPVNISVIYPKKSYENVRLFFGYIQKELIGILKLKKENFTYTLFEIQDFTLDSYQKILASVRDSDLVGIVIDKSHELLKPNESPYYFCKAKFIERGINTQEIQIQQIQKFLSDKNENRPNYTDHNIALNIYAKLGGMAWTIKPNQPKNELIIGVGATTDKDGQPILGLTSIFRGDGKYLLGKVSAVTNMENYKYRLEEIISSAIEDNIRDGILNTDERFYLIFHIFKPAGKNNEVEALKNVVKRFSNYSFDYAFVHVGKGHNYRFFMHEEVKQQVQFTLNKRGLGQNRRGTFIEINNRMGFLGLQPNNSVFHKIEIHKDSTILDLEYIARQIYQFTEMSHTSYNQQGDPITIKYPNLMASFAEKFKEGNLTFRREIDMPNNSLWFI